MNVVTGAVNAAGNVATNVLNTAGNVFNYAVGITEYNDKAVLDLLKKYEKTGSGPTLPTSTVGTEIAKAFGATGALNYAIDDMVNSRKIMVHNGKTIYYVPTVEELLNRLGAARFYENQLEGTFRAQFQGASTVSTDVLNRYLGSADYNIPSANKDAFNARAEEIKNSMANQPGSVGNSKLYPVGEEPKPFAFTGIPKTMTRPKTPELRLTSTPNPFTSFRLVEQMRGGSSVSSHAPLYPKVVMNGGAHPFATLHGGDGAAAVANIKARIEGLERQFKLNSGKTLEDVLKSDNKTSPSKYADTVATAVKDLETALNQLRNANLALASAPLGTGVEVSYDTLVKQGEEISRLAAKTASGWDKLSKIHDMLAELVEKTKTVKLSGGLHNALKH